MTTRDPNKDPKAFLGHELRRARVNAGFSSQEELAVKLGFDRTVIAKAETGERPPTPEVLAPWCGACDLDYEHYAKLAKLARSADDPIPLWFGTWLAAERAATTLRYWSPIIITPIFQTAGYARALLLATQTDVQTDTIDTLVEAKLERAAILDRPDPPDVVALIDELVLYRLIGSSEIMHEQLMHIADLSERPNVCIQIVPTAAGATAGLSGAANLASSDSSPEVLHTDAIPEGQTTEARSSVHQAAVVFDRIRGYAMPRNESHTLIKEVANKRWNQQI